MSALHHAAKTGLVAVVDKLPEINPALADKITGADGRPAHWTALMVLADSWTGSNDQMEALRSLLWASSPNTFQVCGLSSFQHHPSSSLRCCLFVRVSFRLMELDHLYVDLDPQAHRLWFRLRFL